MTIDYTINHKQLSSVKFITKDAEDFVKRRYKAEYEAALYILKKIYKVSFIDRVELVDKNIYYSLLESITLKLLTRYGIFTLVLREDSDIKDLYKFYCKILKPQQHEHYLNEYITTIAIRQKIDNFQDCSKKGIKLDEILLKHGFIQNYQLGKIQFDAEEEPVIMILNDGTYTITGYSSDKCDLNIGEQIQLLERRKQELY